MSDPYAATLALRAPGLLRDFNAAGVITTADVHVATRLGALLGEDDEAVLLAAALVVRSTRHGSVVVDLDTLAETVTPELDDDEVPLGNAATTALPWPADLAARVHRSPLARTDAGAPLRLSGSRLWLARYDDQEAVVARELLDRCAELPADLDLAVLSAGVRRLFPDVDPGDDQRVAAATCTLPRVAVLAGGPGTGKTTTIARVLALLREQLPQARIALAAPTGKAAARLEEAVRTATAALPGEDRERLGDLPATTLHRLLGWSREGRNRFRHNRDDRLPAEIVVVDEASMVSLTLMARLLEALRPTARLLLVGDPDQLASVEAGAVLGDLVDRATTGERTPRMREALVGALPDATAAGAEPAAADSPAARVRDGVALLSTSRRFSRGGGIDLLAGAVRDGNVERASRLLVSGTEGVEFVEVPDDVLLPPERLGQVRGDVAAWGGALRAAARAGDVTAALAALDRHRLLCAHRRGPRGVQYWSAAAARWIEETEQDAAPPPLGAATGSRAGDPVQVTENDHEVQLYNGDTGVIVSDGLGGLVAAFARGGAPILVPLGRLGAVRPVHAMTVHRSQGSQFDAVTVLLPSAGSPLATRETLYTAITRASGRVRVVGSVAAFETAVARPAARASGLRERLAAAGTGGRAAAG